MSSTDISWSDAQLIKLNYSQNPDLLKIQTPNGIQKLNGFHINADHLRQLLDGKNENGIVVQNQVQDIYISFGVNLGDVSKPTNEQYFTIIATSMVSNDVQQTV